MDEEFMPLSQKFLVRVFIKISVILKVKLKKNLENFFNIQAIEQESPALFFLLWSQVLTQDVSIAHAIQAQETQDLHALARKSSTRDFY